MDRLNERLEDAERACRALCSGLAVEAPNDLERDGAIQRFEFTFEAAWKAGQAFLESEEGLLANSPRAIFRALGQAGLLDEAETLGALEMTDDRNRTVHAYIEAVARQIFARLPGHCVLLNALVGRMRSRMNTGNS